MAIMIPSRCLDFIPSSKENLIFESLSKLPDDYYVLYSFHLYDTTHRFYNLGGRPFDYSAGFENETDFIIFVPNEKIIIIEAKASNKIMYSSADHTWYEDDRIMRHDGPFKQASQNRHWISEAMKNAGFEEWSKRFNAFSFSTVWFVGIDQGRLKNMTLPPDVGSLNQIFTKEILDDPLSAIKKIEVPSSNSKQKPFDKREIEYLLNKFFAPPLNFSPSSNFLKDSREQAIKRFTKKQSLVLLFLEEQKFAAISGRAGTGKTFIAYRKAEMQAEKNRKVLFLCYNKLLAKYLFGKNKNNNIEIKTVSQFACDYLHTRKAMFQELCKNLDSLSNLDDFPYDDIIVDEAQDFGREDIEVDKSCANVLSTLKEIIELKEGCFYLFYDKDQLVNNKNAPSILKDPDCKITLYKNCRNTKAIAESSVASIESNPQKSKGNSIIGALPGEKPVAYFVSKEKTQEVVDKIIDSLSLFSNDDIVILTPYEQTSSLSKYVKNDKYFHNGKEYRFYSCRRFKGLEASAVILIDVKANTFNDGDKNFYVGTSRAKFNLFVVFNVNQEEAKTIITCLGGNVPPTVVNVYPLLCSRLKLDYKNI